MAVIPFSVFVRKDASSTPPPRIEGINPEVIERVRPAAQGYEGQACSELLVDDKWIEVLGDTEDIICMLAGVEEPHDEDEPSGTAIGDETQEVSHGSG
jgi:hypothetical protein